MSDKLTILLVEDNPQDAALVAALLDDDGDLSIRFQVEHTATLAGAELALSDDSDIHFDCILLDLNLPGSEGVKNVRRLRALRPDTTIVVITSSENDASAVRALELGAQDFIYKSDLTSPGMARVITHAIVRDRALQSVEAERQQAFELARTDQLTDLVNRQGFEEHCARYLAFARRQQRELSIGYLDLDGFKLVNDQHGHAAGDLVLQQVATALESSLREEDVSARLGGDEFAFVLTGLNESDMPTEAAAQQVAERIVEAVNQVESPGDTKVHCSVGYALYPADGDHYEQLLNHADRAMYAAKHSGGQRALRHAQEPSPLRVVPNR